MRVERMRVEDLDEVLGIERASFPTPWSRHAFLHELRENRVANLWVARAAEGGDEGGSVAGYLCCWVIVDEVHVTNLAVHPAYRRRGVAGRLLGTVLEYYRRIGATRAGLEVRAGNVEARRLYETFGFRQVGLRKGYYFDTGEDALLLEVALAQPPIPVRNSRAG
jgi:ribosomal-protein-alanine N-acetyltransferase